MKLMPIVELPRPAHLVDSREAARQLGISQRSLWTLTHEGQLPRVRVGRLVRYDQNDLVAFIDRNRTKAAS